MITADLIMAAPGGPPCSGWPRERVERVLAHLDCSSWVALAESARAAKWRLVSLADLRLTAYRAATREQRIAGARRSTFVRVDAQVERWPDVSDDVQAIRGELLRWCAGDDDVDRWMLREDAWSCYADAADDAAAAAAAYAVAAAAYAAAYAAADADAAAADADASWAGLLHICTLLDGGTP